MVGYQEPLFPPHENRATVAVADGQVGLLQVALNMTESREPLPMDHVFLFIGAPFLRQKSIAAAYDFCVKISGQFRPVVCQPANAEIPAKKRRRKIHILVG